jgi:hypothetical protein
LARDKKENEKFIFDKFKELFDIPDGDYIHAEPPLPDIVWTTSNNKTIGIEITEAVISQDEFQKDAFKNGLTDLALEKLRDKLPFTFDITIRPYQDRAIGQSQRNSIIDQVVQICLKEAYDLQDAEILTLEDFGSEINTYPSEIQQMILANGFRNLPYGIKSIKIGRWDAAGESWNPHFAGLTVPNFTIEKLRSILDTKEPKLGKYASCNEYWLLIWESGGRHSYYDDISIEEPLNTKFDRVFLARTYRNMVVVLK